MPSVLAADPLLDRLLIVAPAAPGGGWDQTARAMQHALERERLVRIVEVQNVAGAAGTIGLAQFIDAQRGNGAALLVTGLVMLAATVWNESPVSLVQATPIARLTADYEVVAVPAASGLANMRGLVEALRGAPEQIVWGGGSAGGTDHMLVGLIASAAGVDPRRVNYIAFSGGGEAVAALAGGNVTAGVSGYSEFAPHIQSGRLRALAISAASRVPGLDVPTLREAGLAVELANWRAIVAAPSISSDAVARLTRVVERMAQSETWRRTLADRGWIDAYQDGEAFRRYLDAERVRVTRIVSRLRAPRGEAPRLGAWIYPGFVFGGAAVVALLLLNRQRTIATPFTPRDTAAVVRVGGALLLFLLLLEPIGFVVSASVMFVVVASASGARRTSVIAGALFATAVYLAFTRGLALALPAGDVWSWIR